MKAVLSDSKINQSNDDTGSTHKVGRVGNAMQARSGFQGIAHILVIIITKHARIYTTTTTKRKKERKATQ